MINELKKMEIIKIELPEINKINNCYLNKLNLEQYKSKKNNEKCIRCNREPKYFNNDSKELLCWNHCL